MSTAKEKRAAARIALASFDGTVNTKQREMSPRTGPGLLLHGVGQTAMLEDELSAMRKQVAAWDGDAHTRLIDPVLIDNSRWANRHLSSFNTTEFASLKSEISAAGGNVQPIKVRVKGAGRFEVVFGHRRVQACRELGLPVLALIADELGDQALFLEMERENRGRADLSPWEQGVMYRRALDDGLFPSNRKLADAVGINLANLGKCLALSRLPSEVIDAFSSPLEIQMRWGALLARCHESDPDGLLSRAKAIRNILPRPKSKQVFAALLSKDWVGSSELPTQSFSKTELQFKKDGSAVLTIPPGKINPTTADDLLKAIEKLIDKMRA